MLAVWCCPACTAVLRHRKPLMPFMQSVTLLLAASLLTKGITPVLCSIRTGEGICGTFPHRWVLPP